MNELINKFPNGQELFETNPVFNRIVYNIHHGGMSLYDAISIFAEQNKEQQEMMKELIENQPMRVLLTTDKLCECFKDK